MSVCLGPLAWSGSVCLLAFFFVCHACWALRFALAFVLYG